MFSGDRGECLIRVRAVHLPGDKEGNPDMDTLAMMAKNERSARIALAVFSEPDDVTTGRVLARVGAVEAVRLLAGDGPVPGVDSIEAEVWRGWLRPRADAGMVREVVDQSEQGGFGTLIPAGRRGTGYGVFTAVYGLAWLAGSAAIGALYEVSIHAVILFTALAQAVALAAFLPLIARPARPGSETLTAAEQRSRHRHRDLTAI